MDRRKYLHQNFVIFYSNISQDSRICQHSIDKLKKIVPQIDRFDNIDQAIDSLTDIEDFICQYILSLIDDISQLHSIFILSNEKIQLYEFKKCKGILHQIEDIFDVRALTIGTNRMNAPNNYFDGCLDSIAYFGRAKNVTEVLDDATLVAYLRFDGNTLLDSGPLSINGTGMHYSYTSLGRMNNALTLSNLSSYVQITGLRRIGTTGWTYSVAVWINPTNLTGGTIMHLSSRTDGAQVGGWCLLIMRLTSSGQIAINSWNSSNVPITGSSVLLNAWTHVIATYSLTNGERLYVNGTLRGSVGGYKFQAGTVPMTMTLGSSLLGTGVCNTGTIQMGQFYGSFDEFYIYARELTSVGDHCTLQYINYEGFLKHFG
ncbi:hypothetical protein I4U23_017048 [Adineta vaga]|nr:hypothetical protein I4U23_017048 [Adineta vaga]